MPAEDSTGAQPLDKYSARGRSGQPNSTPPVSQLPLQQAPHGGVRSGGGADSLSEPDHEYY